MSDGYIKMSYKAKRGIDWVSWALVIAGACVAVALVVTR